MQGGDDSRCPGCPDLVVLLGREGHLPIFILLEATRSRHQSSSSIHGQCRGMGGLPVPCNPSRKQPLLKEVPAWPQARSQSRSPWLSHPSSSPWMFPTLHKHIRQLGRAPGMLQTSSCRGVVPTPPALTDASVEPVVSPQLCCPCPCGGCRAAPPVPSSAQKAHGPVPCTAPAGLGDAPGFARVPLRE